MSDEPGPSGPWRIAPLTVEDCDELGAVHTTVWREAYTGLMSDEFLAGLSAERSAARWREWAADPETASRTLVASAADGRVVGFISSGQSRDEDAPTEWELYAINLLAAVHGSGLADAMIERSVGSRPASLWVAEGNFRARAFYARHGFVAEGGRKDHDVSGAPEIRLVRR